LEPRPEIRIATRLLWPGTRLAALASFLLPLREKVSTRRDDG
jgi:hypothetical protein